MIHDRGLYLIRRIGPGQRPGQGQGKGDRRAQGFTGDDVAVDGDGQAGVAGPGGGQVGVHARVDRGFFAAQHAKRRQRRGRGADGRHDFALRGKVGADLAHRGIGFQVRHAGDTTGQDAGVKRRVVQFLGQGVRHNVDLPGALDDALPAHRRDSHFDPRAAQDINAEQPLALLQPRGKKDDSFRHNTHSLFK